jgi:hypothetical protein
MNNHVHLIKMNKVVKVPNFPLTTTSKELIAKKPKLTVQMVIVKNPNNQLVLKV